jgi:hypothetical protein
VAVVEPAKALRISRAAAASIVAPAIIADVDRYSKIMSER